MPLPRFDRLPEQSRAAILAVAREHFARDGKDAASFNQIIAAAGISKTSAYHYFDGKDDLFGAVVADAAARCLRVLGEWQPVSTVDQLWTQLTKGTTRLLAHLRDHPEDRALLAAASPQGADPWVAALVANGIELGAIAAQPSAELMTIATAGVLSALDSWALQQPDLPASKVTKALRLLLSRLWGSAVN